MISAARRVRWLAMVGVLLISAGCGDSSGTGATSPTKSPSVTQTPFSSPATCDEPEATTIELVASSVLFNVTCLVVPAGEPLDVTLRNEDGVNHNFSIYTLEFASEFTGEISFGGETFHHDVPAFQPGEYFFQCDIHPRDMEGPPDRSMTGVRWGVGDGSVRPSEPSVPPVLEPFDGTERLMCT